MQDWFWLWYCLPLLTCSYGIYELARANRHSVRAWSSTVIVTGAGVEFSLASLQFGLLSLPDDELFGGVLRAMFLGGLFSIVHVTSLAILMCVSDAESSVK